MGPGTQVSQLEIGWVSTFLLALGSDLVPMVRLYRYDIVPPVKTLLLFSCHD